MAESKRLEITEIDDGLKLTVYVVPKASKSQLVGLYGGALKIRLAAAPVDGAANKELVAFIAKLLKVSKSAVSIVRGHTSKRKIVKIDGVTLKHMMEKVKDCV